MEEEPSLGLSPLTSQPPGGSINVFIAATAPGWFEMNMLRDAAGKGLVELKDPGRRGANSI